MVFPSHHTSKNAVLKQIFKSSHFPLGWYGTTWLQFLIFVCCKDRSKTFCTPSMRLSKLPLNMSLLIRSRRSRLQRRLTISRRSTWRPKKSPKPFEWAGLQGRKLSPGWVILQRKEHRGNCWPSQGRIQGITSLENSGDRFSQKWQQKPILCLEKRFQWVRKALGRKEEKLKITMTLTFHSQFKQLPQKSQVRGVDSTVSVSVTELVRKTRFSWGVESLCPSDSSTKLSMEIVKSCNIDPKCEVTFPVKHWCRDLLFFCTHLLENCSDCYIVQGACGGAKWPMLLQIWMKISILDFLIAFQLSLSCTISRWCATAMANKRELQGVISSIGIVGNCACTKLEDCNMEKSLWNGQKRGPQGPI